MFWPELADIRRWVDETPPSNLHSRGIIEGKLVEPWDYPIIVENDPSGPMEPRRKVVSRQGLDGTTSKYVPTGESGRLAPGGSTVVVDFQGEPMAGDPVSHELRSVERRIEPGQ